MTDKIRRTRCCALQRLTTARKSELEINDGKIPSQAQPKRNALCVTLQKKINDGINPSGALQGMTLRCLTERCHTGINDGINPS